MISYSTTGRLLINGKTKFQRTYINFGDGFIVRPESKETFRATVKVSVSRTFYAWVFQFAGGIRIAGSESVREEYMEMLKNAMR